MAPFSEEEVKMAIFDIEHNKAPGLDGFPVEFYQFFWDVVKQDLMSLFFEFYINGNRDPDLLSGSDNYRCGGE